MIQLNISSDNIVVIEQIAQELIEGKLAIDVNIHEHVTRLNVNAGKLIKVNQYLLTAKTKSLLFSNIDQKLKDLFPNSLPEIHSVPIISINNEQAEYLTQSVLKV